MLGSSRVNVRDLVQQLPEDLQKAVASKEYETSEEELMTMLSVLMPYTRAGHSHAQYLKPIALAPEEERPYVHAEFGKIIRGCVQTGNYFFLRIALERCAEAEKIVSPDLIPDLLALMQKEPSFTLLIPQVIGHRGAWLMAQNEAWQTDIQDLKSAWELGKGKLREWILQQAIDRSITEALELIEGDWKSLSAKERRRFFEMMMPHLDVEQQAFLQKAAKDRSVAIKKLANIRLAQLPGTELHESLKGIFHESVALVSKGVFGLGGKEIELRPRTLTADMIKQLQLQEESLDNQFSDAAYQFMELLEYMPPQFWTRYLQIPAKVVFEQFLQSKKLRKYINSFIASIVHNRESTWAAAFFETVAVKEIKMNKLHVWGQQLVGILSPDDLQRGYERGYLDWLNELDISTLSRIQQPWDLSFSKSVLRKLKSEYMDRGLSQAWVAEMATLGYWMHPEIIPLQKFFMPSPNQRRESWRQAIDRLFNNIALKQKIDTVTL